MSLLRKSTLILLMAGLTGAGGCNVTEQEEPEPTLLLGPATPDYNGFQLALLAQGSLMLVEQNGFLWPAHATDTALLESFPPQMRVTAYHSDEATTYFINEIYGPDHVSDENYQADVYIKSQWTPVKSFRLNHLNYEYQTDSSDVWQPVSPESVRFSKR